MNIKEIEERSGLPRSGIRYYEAEGLLSPARLENGYRDYSEADLETLLKIKRLRGLGLTLAGIRRIQSGESTLAAELQEALERLSEQSGELLGAQQECRWLLECRASWEGLLDVPQRPALPSAREPEAEAVRPGGARPGPWRRFFARWLDELIANAAAFAAAVLLLRLNPVYDRTLCSLWIWVVGVALFFVFEPICLSLFGATPGKALLGIRAVGRGGGRLRPEEAARRCWRMLWSGEALRVPFVELYTLYRAYARDRRGEYQPWEYESRLEARPRTGALRGALSLGCAALVLCAMFFAALAGEMPRHRGDMSTAEFAENYNDLADYATEGANYQHMSVRGLSDNTPRELFGTHLVTLCGDGGRPEFSFTESGGVLRRVEFSASGGPDSKMVGTYRGYIQLALRAFVWGRPGAGTADFEERMAMLDYIEQRPCQSFSAEWAGVRVTCDFTYTGYRPTHLGLRPQDPSPDRSYTVNFVMELA